MFCYDKGINTLVSITGPNLDVWMKEHPTFREVNSYDAGTIAATNGWGWSMPITYYGGTLDGIAISTASDIYY